MGPKVIVSYDDTANDRDGLALGRLFAWTGATVSLAYVRHTQESELAQERLEERDAEELLARGAELLAGDVQRHVVLSASTGDGLRQLAERERTDIVVFGSDYRTPAGRVDPGTSARRLLEGGPAAIALAPAELRNRADVRVARVGLIPGDGDETAHETASRLASALGALPATSIDEPIDLLVVGSRPEAPQGLVMISASAEYAIQNAFCPVLVVPRGVVLPFEERAPTLTTAKV
jgi:nucleotide-binding universal stress UspA family protein